ncbi:MAG: DUF4403 family protein [Bacteroidota bacterium]
MRFQFYQLIFFVLLVTQFFACKSTQPARPVEAYNEDNRFARQTSVIRIPIQIDMDKMEQSLNQQLTDKLYEDDSFDDGDNMKVIARKDGIIKLGVEQDAVSYKVPLDLWIQYKLGFGRVEATAGLILDFKTAWSINSNWQLQTHTELQTHEWTERPRLRMAGVSIPVQSIANAILRRSTEDIGTNIDTMVAQSFQLDQAVGDAWKLLFEPYEVSPEYQTWLVANPTDIGMTPVRASGNTLDATIVVQSEPELHFGPRPIVPAPRILPNFQYRNLNPDAPSGFQIFLDATVSYEEAQRLTKQSIQGERFEQGKRYVVVEDVELYGQGNNIVVNLRMSGSYDGSIYLTGEPVFNARRNRIEIEDLEYTLDSKNFLLKSAAWLAKGTLKKKLQENMDYLLEYNLQDAQRQMQEQLADYEVNPGVRLQGSLDELQLYNAYLTTEGIKVVMSINGDLGVRVQGLATGLGK